MENFTVQSAEELHQEEVHEAYERWMEEREREDLCMNLHGLSSDYLALDSKNDNVLGCFHCLNVYTADQIHRDDISYDGNKQTVLCHFCSVDSILFKYQVDKLTQMDFNDVLKMMKKRWFEDS